MGLLDDGQEYLRRSGRNLGGLLEWLGGGAVAGAEPTMALMRGDALDQPLLPTADSGGRIGAVASAVGSTLMPVAAPTGAMGAGPVIRRDLFDYSKLDQVPDVPQVPLERTVPPKGPSARVQALDTKKVLKKFNDAVDKGSKAGVPWYNTEPLRRAFIDELGEVEGTRRYGLYMDMVAATSPRSDVGTNARNASYYYQQALQGKEVTPPLPSPYGHMAQKLHAQNYANIMEHGGMGPETTFPVLQNPKPPSFSQNLQGNQMPVTADTHYVRNWGVSSKDPEWLLPTFKVDKDAPAVHPRELVTSGKTKLKDVPPVWWDSMPRPNEYPMLELLGQREAKKKGMTPAQYQASAWVGAGENTGLASGADPFLRHFENRVMLTADKTGLPPQEVLQRFMRGEMTLLSAPPVPGPGLLDETPKLEDLRDVL